MDEDDQDNEKSMVNSAFTTIAKVSSPSDHGVENRRKPYLGAKLEYHPDEYNTIAGKFTEYFTSKLAKDCVLHSDALKVQKKYFKVDNNEYHVDVSLAECIGRGFFG